MITFKQLGKLGALGNQMFEYASLRGIANKCQQEWAIPRQGSRTIYYNLFDLFEMGSVKEENLLNDDENFPEIRPKSFAFDPNLFNIKTSCNLNHYLQSYKYFEHVHDEVINDFIFKKEHIKPVKFDYIFIHVRRTEHVKLNHLHPVCNIDYFNTALENFPSEIPVKVFSDDLDWCKENFKGDRFIIKDKNPFYEEKIYLSGIKQHEWYAKPFDDMYEMANAVGGIISNSTLSWWGAYLIKNRKYPIICPEPWFGPSMKHDTKDLCPPDWIKIKNV